MIVIASVALMSVVNLALVFLLLISAVLILLRGCGRYPSPLGTLSLASLDLLWVWFR